MDPSNNGHDHMFPSPPSLHPLTNPPSAYPSPDDLSRHQRHPAMEGYASQMMSARHHQNQREHSTTYVPSLVPPGVDPSQVDVRTFYPYQPNEVKHRKRTTRQQLKILEGVYEYDKKPNAGLRKKLADELAMTPRGVQVWFQNRRAKEKNLARKAEQARDGGVPLKQQNGLNASAAPESSSALGSSSPTPVSSKPPKAAETSSSRTSPGSATPPPAPAPASSPVPVRSEVTSENAGALEDGESPFVQSPPSREASVPSAYLSSTPTPSAAEILAQRRPSLPILSITPSASSSQLARGTRASIHVGGGGSGLLSVSNGQPHGFDPAMRRRSVDTSIKRLITHPYAHLARGTNDRFHSANPSHLHSLAPPANSDGAGRLDPLSGAPGRIGHSLRRESMPHVLASMDVPGRMQRRGNAMQDYATSTAFSQGDMAPPRPTLVHKHSMPVFHESSQDFRPSQRSISSGQPGSMPIFTNPNPFASSMSAGSSPAFSYDTPVSPLASGTQPPPSPSSASPPPISQSLLHSYGHGLHAPARTVQPPIPGPLPEPTFSFGDPSGSPSLSSSAASSPPSDHSTVVDGPARRDSADSAASLGGPDTDDASQGSSAYDPLSRFGSFASESSCTSYWSEPADPQAQKPETLEAPENFDPARRGSFASAFLPQLLDSLDVTDSGTPQPQPFASDAPSEQIPPQIAESRRGSHAQPGQAAYAQHMHVYGGQYPYLGQDQPSYAPPDHQMPYPSTGQDPYSANGDVYVQMGKPEMQQHVESHGAYEMQSMCSSSSSELAYALHPQGNMSNGQSQFAVGYPDSTGQGNAHPPTASEQPTQFDNSSAKAAHYGQETYEQQATSYSSFPPEQQTAYADQQQPAYPEQPSTYPEPQMAFFPYAGYQATAMSETGAVDLGSMCIPSSLMMGGDFRSYA